MKTNQILLFFCFAILLTVVSNNSLFAQGKSDKFVVVLDAGHGGHDPGNLGNGFKEKDIALNIVLKVGKELEKHPNIKVVYTRKKDVFIDLFVRGKIANNAEADLFVSVHCNSFSNSAHGTETFVLGLHANERNFKVAKAENEVIYLEENYEKNYAGFNPSSPESYIGLTLMQEEYLDQSIQLADLIEKNFKGRLKRKSRGVKQAGFIVLHQTAMPSVLVETGFLTYKPEGVYLNSNKGQTDMANAIKDAILSYKHNLDLNVGLVSSPSLEDINNEVDKSEIYDGVVFKVQIAASSRKLEPKPYNFKGLDDMSREQFDNLYKYYYGNTSDYTKIKQMQEQAKSKGYNSCFIVAYKDGRQISMDEALKSTVN
ncbi:N-acetylmuramoyl-L-alanine amidase family protein [Hanstruepera marina]|uniref:N-acetylmuramoyl-L-alanine amidase family protein n=1 Tax=Hanstruepera marina TaxID=2873265 RepID=UPI001CA72029|nr:N-acetylmuramoyl-L-alanine amidase [Hanstruepera marina]